MARLHCAGPVIGGRLPSVALSSCQNIQNGCAVHAISISVRDVAIFTSISVATALRWPWHLVLVLKLRLLGSTVPLHVNLYIVAFI